MNFQKLSIRNHLRSQFKSPKEIGLSLNNAIEEYLHWKGSFAPTAFKRYETRLTPFSKFIGNSQNITKITIRDIIEYHLLMKDQGYSPKTIEYSCVILKNFFKFWAGRGVIGLNPIEIRSMRCLSPYKQIVNENDFEKMNEVLDERFFEELSRKLAINLLWDCGMRVSELCGLNISDISDLHKPGIRCAKIQRRKSMRYDIVVWGEETDRLLNLYLGIRLSINHSTDALFISRKGYETRTTTRTVQRWIKDVAEMAMIEKDLTPHSFRHSKAHRILDKGENVRDVQCILGHGSPISSFHYLSLSPERQYEISAKYLDIKKVA